MINAQAHAIGARVARLGWHVQLLIDLAAHSTGALRDDAFRCSAP
jgi:hypothetical protein